MGVDVFVGAVVYVLVAVFVRVGVEVDVFVAAVVYVLVAVFVLVGVFVGVKVEVEPAKGVAVGDTGEFPPRQTSSTQKANVSGPPCVSHRRELI